MPARIVWRFLALCSVLLLTACGEADGGSNTSESEIRTAEATWRDLRADDYSFDFRVRCVCPSGDAHVVVRNDRITSVHRESLDVFWHAQNNDDVKIISQLFDLALDAHNRAHSLQVTFHPTRGYPTHLKIDWDHNHISDSYTLDVYSLVIE